MASRWSPEPIGRFRFGETADVVSRLKVLADLLTYRTDVPQEGRLREKLDDTEMRVSTFPTLFGERAVIRLFTADQELVYPNQLGLPTEVQSTLQRVLAETNGAVLIVGPAGSGKTTTAYACLRHLVRDFQGGRSIVSLEDPIEVAVDGVAQSQVNPSADFDLLTGLKSMLRQDPEVLLIGEMRDRATAEVAIHASLTGQLVLTTFHAGSSIEAISRLLDMGIEPYMIRSGVLAILSQRLVRRLCSCAKLIRSDVHRLGLPVDEYRHPVGCKECGNTGYRGRLILAELFQQNTSEIGDAILERAEKQKLAQLAQQANLKTLWDRGLAAVQSGDTSPTEIRRVLGFEAA